MYYDLQELIFGKAKKLCIAADPSGYGEKTLVSILWSPKMKAACYPPVQIIPCSNLMSPLDGDMTDRLRALAQKQRLQRVASYREWQALSHALFQATGSVSLDSFAIPADIIWQRVSGDDQRSTRIEDNNAVAYVFNRATKQRRHVFPPAMTSEELEMLHQLTVAMDSGSTGRAGGMFAVHKLEMNVFVVYDKIHRLIRDVKLAAEKAAGGALYRALLHVCFVFSLNQRPFGSGEWFHKKQELLAFFMETTTPDDPIFRNFADHIASDRGTTVESLEDRAALFSSLAELPSFTRKGVAPKMMRWFSVNDLWEERSQEFYALKMILQHCSGSFEREANKQNEFGFVPSWLFVWKVIL